MEVKQRSKNDHNHEHGSIFGKDTELYFAILSGVFFFTGLIIELATTLPEKFAIYSYMAAYFFGGYFTLTEAIEKVRNGEFEIDFLMIVAAIGAAYIGSWEEGALLLFLFSLGHALEKYAMNKAKKSIEALGNLSRTQGQGRWNGKNRSKFNSSFFSRHYTINNGSKIKAKLY